jgi:NAD-dependent SIR2 family protein deacetylase
MKLTNKEVLIDAVENADMILIGIGEEWSIPFEEMQQETVFAGQYAKMTDDKIKERLVPVLQREYLKEIRNEKLKTAYENLYHLSEGKNCFLLSMNKDRYPYLAGFSREKCVFPCGGYEMLQCDTACTDELVQADEVSDRIYQNIVKEGKLETLHMPSCPHCQKEMVYNNMEALKYVEKGYLPAWEYYMKWLQGTVNHKLCLLELGVSMKFPSVIRWPFEKTTYYNQKAQMFRIHHSLSQSMEMISDRCYSCDQNSVDYLANLFVS